MAVETFGSAGRLFHEDIIMTNDWRGGIGAAAVAVVGLCVAGGAQGQPPAGYQAAPQAAGAAKAAVAKLAPTKDSTARGEVTFTQETGGVHVVGSFSGLAMGEHGFHVHEKGDCSAPDGTSAGGHFNPATKPHGAREAADRHVGDLGNFKADPYGLGRVDFVDPQLALSGANSILQRAVIIHEKPDDFTTQPTGNAGARLACGVIESK
jgi:Cu-Zn family superoxide dismutase